MRADVHAIAPRGNGAGDGRGYRCRSCGLVARGVGRPRGNAPGDPRGAEQAAQAFVSLAGRVIAGGRHECPPAPTITLRLRLEDANGTLTEALLSVPVERFCHPDCICEEFERYGMAGASRIVAWKLEEP